MSKRSWIVATAFMFGQPERGVVGNFAGSHADL